MGKDCQDHHLIEQSLNSSAGLRTRDAVSHDLVWGGDQHSQPHFADVNEAEAQGGSGTGSSSAAVVAAQGWKA